MKLVILLTFLFSSLAFGADDALMRNALEGENVSKVKSLIASGEFTVNSMIQAEPYGEGGMSLISVAARAGSVQVVKYLISAKADLNLGTILHETPLMLACYYDDSLYGGQGNSDKNDQAAMELIQAGAALENDGYYYPLAYAAYRGRVKIAQKLLAAGAKINGPAKDGKTPINTPLMMAALGFELKFLKMLLVAGADPKITKIKDGNTALTLAKKHGNTDAIPLLECAEKLKPGEAYAEKCQ